MSGADFEHFCRILHDHSGLLLGPEKAYLVRSRLEPVARAEGFPDTAALLAALRKGAANAMVERCVNALATHESSFFRDATPFDLLTAKVLPELMLGRDASRGLRIWCAACSSGQEPYSVAIALQELGAAMSGWRIEIVATDFSNPILEKARAGIYSDFEVRRGLSPARLERWFRPCGGGWQAIPQLRQMVSFKTHNLLHGSERLGGFDVIFCRNVLIYFDNQLKRRVLEDLARSLAPDGVLYLGSAETILGLTSALEMSTGMRGVFRRAGSGALGLTA